MSTLELTSALRRPVRFSTEANVKGFSIENLATADQRHQTRSFTKDDVRELQRFLEREFPPEPIKPFIPFLAQGPVFPKAFENVEVIVDPAQQALAIAQAIAALPSGESYARRELKDALTRVTMRIK